MTRSPTTQRSRTTTFVVDDAVLADPRLLADLRAGEHDGARADLARPGRRTASGMTWALGWTRALGWIAASGETSGSASRGGWKSVEIRAKARYAFAARAPCARRAPPSRLDDDGARPRGLEGPPVLPVGEEGRARPDRRPRGARRPRCGPRRPPGPRRRRGRRARRTVKPPRRAPTSSTPARRPSSARPASSAGVPPLAARELGVVLADELVRDVERRGRVHDPRVPSRTRR